MRALFNTDEKRLSRGLTDDTGEPSSEHCASMPRMKQGHV
jgi:hypothetical protein